jgi:hypothetical protein
MVRISSAAARTAAVTAGLVVLGVVGASHGTVHGDRAFVPRAVRPAASWGADDAVALPAPFFGPAFTIEGWVYQHAPGTHDILGVCVDPNSDCTGTDYRLAGFRVNRDGSLTAGFSDAVFSGRHLFGTTRATGVLVPGRWYHLALTADSATNDVGIYVNGEAQALTRSNGDPAVRPFSARPYLGGRDGTFGGVRLLPFSGLIDEAAIYSRVLSSSEIWAIADTASATGCRRSSDAFVIRRPGLRCRPVGDSRPLSTLRSDRDSL